MAKQKIEPNLTGEINVVDNPIEPKAPETFTNSTVGEVTAISNKEYKVGTETVREITIVIGGSFEIGKKVEVKKV